MHGIDHCQGFPIIFVLLPQWVVLRERLVHETWELMLRKLVEKVADTFVCIFCRLFFGLIVLLILRFFVFLVIKLAWSASEVTWISNCGIYFIICITTSTVTINHFLVTHRWSLPLTFTWCWRQCPKITFIGFKLINRGFLIGCHTS